MTSNKGIAVSEAFYDMVGLRFWREREIQQREQFTARLAKTLSDTLLDINQGWRIERVEAPLIMPRNQFSGEYTDREVFPVLSDHANQRWALRAETTPGTYAFAQHLLTGGDPTKVTMRPPLALWQAGQSFRREATDGARPATLRFNQFWQWEAQCVYRADSGAAQEYVDELRREMASTIADLVGTEVRLVESDRLPAYATETVDIEAMWQGEWKEVASTSIRTDFPKFDPYLGTTPKNTLVVFEVAVGLDRLVAVCNQQA